MGLYWPGRARSRRERGGSGRRTCLHSFVPTEGCHTHPPYKPPHRVPRMSSLAFEKKRANKKAPLQWPLLSRPWLTICQHHRFTKCYTPQIGPSWLQSLQTKCLVVRIPERCEISANFLMDTLQVKDCDFFRLDPVMQKQYSIRLGTKVYLLIGLAGDGNK